MTKFIAMFALIFLGTAGWRIGEQMSSDARMLAVGILLGVGAGIPTVLLVLAADRRDRLYDEYQPEYARPKLTVYSGEQEPAPISLPDPAVPPTQVVQHYHYHAAPGEPVRQIEGAQ